MAAGEGARRGEDMVVEVEVVVVGAEDVVVTKGL